jgi:hypothetical protein
MYSNFKTRQDIRDCFAGWEMISIDEAGEIPALGSKFPAKPN